MESKKFVWDPSVNQEYTDEYGSQGILDVTITKNNFKGFDMNAAGETFSLVSGNSKSLDFGENSILKVSSGTLNISSLAKVSGVHGGVGNFNNSEISALDTSALKFNDILLKTNQQKAPTDIQATGQVLFVGVEGALSGIEGKFNVNVGSSSALGGYFYADVTTLKLDGGVRFFIYANPTDSHEYSCDIKTKSFSLKGNNNVAPTPDDGTISVGETVFVCMNSSKSKLLALDSFELNETAYFRVQDNSSLHIECAEDCTVEVSGKCFEIDVQESVLTIGTDGRDNPLIFTCEDEVNGRYQGIFDFRENVNTDTDSQIILKGISGGQGAIIRNGKYVTVSGKPAIYGIHYTLTQSFDNPNDYIIKLL